MEDKINIAEILRDIPKGTKLYSPLFGEVELREVCIGNAISVTVTDVDGKKASKSFSQTGRRYANYPQSECVLFPSSEMRDWPKFFKRGDVVRIKDIDYTACYAIFDRWKNDNHTEFYASIFWNCKSGFKEEKVCTTRLYTKVSNKLKAELIACIEKHYNGKYNPDTLKVETVKPKYQLKPFDKVLVRNGWDERWSIDFYESIYDNSHAIFQYKCMTNNWKFCIPYEGNEHLLGTTDNPNN